MWSGDHTDPQLSSVMPVTNIFLKCAMSSTSS